MDENHRARGYGRLVIGGALLLIVGVVAASSFLTTLRHAIGRKAELSPREAERARLRVALGDMLLDMSEWARPGRAAVDHKALRASMPILQPSLSQTIIEAREEERADS